MNDSKVEVWICAKCGHGSAEHGMVGHAAYQCAFEPMLRTTYRYAHEDSAELTRKLEELTPLLSNAIRERNKYDAECDRLEAKVEELEAKLAAMTEDRDLIMSKGDGSCDNCGVCPAIDIPTSLCEECRDGVARAEKAESRFEKTYERLHEVTKQLFEAGAKGAAQASKLSKMLGAFSEISHTKSFDYAKGVAEQFLEDRGELPKDTVTP